MGGAGRWSRCGVSAVRRKPSSWRAVSLQNANNSAIGTVRLDTSARSRPSTENGGGHNANPSPVERQPG